MHLTKKAAFLTPEHMTGYASTDSMTRSGKLFIAVLLIAVFEGAVRKWVSEGLTTPIVLLRDALALWAVVHAVQLGILRFNKPAGALLGIWTFLVLGWALLQAVANEMPFSIFAIGVRFWLLYWWFAVASAISLTERDFKVACYVVGALTLVLVPLVVVQYLSPPTAFINKQVGEDSEIFVVTLDKVRTTATFSFTLGFSAFLSLALPLALALLTSKKEMGWRRWWRYAVAGAAAIGLTVSGSRGAFVFTFILLITYFIHLFVFARVRLKMSTYVSILVGLAIAISVGIIFSGALDALEERTQEAALNEDAGLRMLEMVTGAAETWDHFNPLGAGLGYGTNYAGMEQSGERDFLYGENEIDRVLGTGGILGIFYIGVKLLVAAAGLWRAASVARKGSAVPLLLWVSASIALITAAITGQLTVNVFVPTMVAFAWAALRFPRVGATN